MPPAPAATTEIDEPEPEPPSCGLALVIVMEDQPAAWAQLAPATAIAAVADAAGRHACLRASLPAEANVVLATDAAVRALNRQWRAQDKPTNVLSFPAAVERRRLPPGVPLPLGDIVLAAGTVLREAAEQGMPPLHHVQHLVLHGLLHLVGYDHETDAQAAAMEALETAILAGLGIPDPYADSDPMLSPPPL